MSMENKWDYECTVLLLRAFSLTFLCAIPVFWVLALSIGIVGKEVNFYNITAVLLILGTVFAILWGLTANKIKIGE